MRLDAGLLADLVDVPARAAELAATGIDGLFTFEGNSDVFFPLAAAAPVADVDLYTNVAIAFPRSPMHLAYQAWDLQRLSGGRFALGLGTQIRPHIERRYSATWSKPVERMAELVQAIKSVFACWHEGTPLDHHGEHYRLDLMTPIFVPSALDGEPPPIWVGALGPRMTETMAGAADGIVIHPFNTSSFLRERTQPLVDAGLESAGRTTDDLSLVVGCIAAPALTEEALDDATRAVRFNLAFYGSTPAYRVTLDHHGLGELQPRLRELTKTGRWDELGDLVTDEVVDLIAVRGTPEHVAAELLDRYGDLADRLALSLPGGVDPAALASVVDGVRAGSN